MKRLVSALAVAALAISAHPAAAAGDPATAEARGAVWTLSLAEALERVDRLDPKLRARAFAEAVEIVQARRARWNRVTGNVTLMAGESLVASGLGTVGGDAPASLAENHSVSAQAFVRVPLYAGGALDGAIDAADARLQAARFDRERTRQELRAAATRAYAEVVYARRALGIAERAAERAKRLIELTGARVRSGVAPEADLARAQLNALRQEEDVAARAGAIEQAMAVLRALLVVESSVVLDPHDSLEALAKELSPPATPAPRPDVRAEAARVRAAEADARVAFAGYLPRLELQGFASYGNGLAAGAGAGPGGVGAPAGGVGVPGGAGLGAPGAGMNPGAGGAPLLFGQPVFTGFAVASAQLSWNVWDLFVTRDNVARAEAEASRVRANLADRQRQARREQGETRAQRAQAAARMEVLEHGAATARNAVTLDEARYRAGTALLAEVVQTEIQAIDIEQRAALAAFDWVRACVDGLLAEGRTP